MTHGPGFYEQQVFRWLRIEHADGQTRDWPYLWFTADELAAMSAEEVEAAKVARDQNLWFWAENLELGQAEGPKVTRIVAEWIGPIGSQPS